MMMSEVILSNYETAQQIADKMWKASDSLETATKQTITKAK
jgi:hypothetical protein